MNETTFHRLHALRMENDAVQFAMDDQRPRFDRLKHRHTNGTAPRAVAVHQLFQTPPELAGRLVGLLDLTPGARVLEPSAGLGRLLDSLADWQPRETVAVEIAAECAAELYRQERAGVTIKQRDFLSLRPDDLGPFDAVAMNPPFHMRADVRHILHALDFLRPGGELAALCLDTHHRETAFRELACHWERIPAGAFRSTGTNVPTVLLKIIKP